MLLASSLPESAAPTGTISIPVHGLVDHVRAEAVATRIRSAVRNGRRSITVVFAGDAVIASPSFVAFLVRAAALLGAEGGRLAWEGDPLVLAQLQALGLTVPPAGKTKGAAS